MNILKIFPISLISILGIAFFVPHVSAISLSVGDPVEVFNLYVNVTTQLKQEYAQFQKDIEAGKAVPTQFDSILALIKQLDSLNAKFASLLDISKDNKITVVYPNGGETLECGKTYKITWNMRVAPNQALIDSLKNPTIGIFLEGTDGEGGSTYIAADIVRNLKATDRSYDWTLPCETKNGSYYIRVVANPDLGITNFEDFSDKTFKIISAPDALVNSLSADKTSINSGESVAINWSGSNVREYKIFFGSEYGLGAEMNGEYVTSKVVPVGLQTSASFTYTNLSANPQKVYVTVEAYGIREFRDSFKSVEITVNPQEPGHQLF